MKSPKKVCFLSSKTHIFRNVALFGDFKFVPMLKEIGND